MTRPHGTHARYAKLAGVPHGTLSKLMYGDPARHMPPSRRVRPATARRVMAVMPQHAAGAQRVPAGPTWRLLNQLIGLGWSRAELARRLGHQGPGLQIRKDRVLASTARAVERLHAELVQVRVIPKKTRWGVRPIPAQLQAGHAYVEELVCLGLLVLFIVVGLRLVGLGL